MIVGGRYRLGAPLGQGGWGTVYEATQLDLDRRVAVKMLNAAALSDPTGVSRFEREAKAAAALGHPNIVQVIDFVSAAGQPPFIVLEHLSGRTLAALLRAEKRLAPARAFAIAKQVLSALEAAHRAGIVHRDVKPANIFLVAAAGVEDFVKLLDFGVAKLTGAGVPLLTGMGEIIGTPSYMAPEQIRGGVIDARTDVYAVGVMLYLAVSGRLPFAGDATEIMTAILTQPAAPLAPLCPELEPRLVAVIERAMEKDADRRFADASEMRAALDAPARAAPGALAFAPARSAAPTLAGETARTLTSAPSPEPAFPGPADPTLASAHATPDEGESMSSRRTLVTVLAAVAVLLLVVLIAGGAAFVHLVRQPPPTLATPPIAIDRDPPPTANAETAASASSAPAPTPSHPVPVAASAAAGPLPSVRTTPRVPRGSHKPINLGF